MKVIAMCVSGNWYSICYCVASVMETFTLKGVQTIHQHLTDTDKVVCQEFCMQMFHWIQDERFLDSAIFSEESTFHVSG
jgi:hypothetical protein